MHVFIFQKGVVEGIFLTLFQKWPFRIVGVVHFSARMCLKGGLEGSLEA